MNIDICEKCGADRNSSADRDAKHCTCTYSHLKYMTADPTTGGGAVKGFRSWPPEVEYARRTHFLIMRYISRMYYSRVNRHRFWVRKIAKMGDRDDFR